MNKNTDVLDIEELLQLGLRAVGQQDPEAAIGYLKRVLDLDPEHPNAMYLLGAVHAELGLVQRSIDEIARAVELGVDAPIAHFQLGMLFLRTGDLAAAENSWRPLDALGENSAHFLFKRGMLALAADRIEDFLEDVNRGIGLNTDDEALNENMREVMREGKKLISEQSDSERLDTTQAESSSRGQHMLLSKYLDEE